MNLEKKIINTKKFTNTKKSGFEEVHEYKIVHEFEKKRDHKRIIQNLRKVHRF